MDAERRLKVYTVFADNTRKWVTVMDAKAAFLSALNGVLVGVVWAGAKVGEGPTPETARNLGIAASVASFFAMLAALWSIMPRESLGAVFGGDIKWSGDYRPFSFYRFIAATYKPQEFARLESDLGRQDEAALGQEALEQHFTVAHVVAAKGVWVSRAGYLSLCAIVLAAVALITKVGAA